MVSNEVVDTFFEPQYVNIGYLHGFIPLIKESLATCEGISLGASMNVDG